MKLQNPFLKATGSAYSNKELLDILTKEPSGHYLISNHDFWHGGVHFSEQGEAELKKQPVVAIADGTIVAYKISKGYDKLTIAPPPPKPEPTTQTSTQTDTAPTATTNDYRYTSAFCLIRHEYISPDAPQKMQSKDPVAQQQDWKGRTVTLQEGRNARDPSAENDKNAQFRVTLAPGTRLKIIDISGTDNKFIRAQIVSFAATLDRSASFADAKSATNTKKTLHIGDEVYLSVFEAGGNVALTTKKDPLITDATSSVIDWSETTALTVKAAQQGHNQTTSPSLAINVPAGTQLEIISNTPVLQAGQHYLQVKAAQPLSTQAIPSAPTPATAPQPSGSQATTPPAAASPSQTTVPASVPAQWPANTSFWLAVSDEFGNLATAQVNGKTAAAIETKRNQNKLTFYSLYMHLLPWTEYAINQASTPQTPPRTYLQVTNKNGLTLRDDQLAAIGTRKAALSQVLEYVEAKTQGGLVYNKIYLADTAGTRSEEKTYWVNTGSASNPSAHIKPYTPVPLVQQTPIYWKHEAPIQAKVLSKLEVYTLTSNGGKNLLGHLDNLQAGDEISYNYVTDRITQKVTVGQNTEDMALIRISTTAKGENGKISSSTSTLYLSDTTQTAKSLQERVTPTRMDQVITDKPIAVKAGEPLGYLGLYESPSEDLDPAHKNARHMLHYEIFTADDARIRQFLGNQYGVEVGQKYLHIDKGAALIIGTDYNKPVATIAGLNTHYCTSASNATLKRNWSWSMSQVQLLTRNKTEKWYRIGIANLPKDHYGWIKQGPNTQELSQYDLEKLDFVIIEEKDTRTNGDAYIDLNQVSAQGQGELNNYFQDLYTEIDPKGVENGQLSLEKLQAANKDLDGMAQTLRKIVGYHPSEWRGLAEPVQIVAKRIEQAINDSNKPAGEAASLNAEQQKLAEAKAQGGNEEQQAENIVKTFAGQAQLDALKQERKRIETLAFWEQVPELKSSPSVWHFHPIAFVEFLSSLKAYFLGPIFICVKFGQSTAGPWYQGSMSLASYPKWDALVAQGTLTTLEVEIFKAVSRNEGNLDSVQSYDSEILSAGAMQKTVNKDGKGEFPIQVDEFRKTHPALYARLFTDYGWHVVSDPDPRVYYIDPRDGQKYEGIALKTLIRTGYTAELKGHRLECLPLEAIIKAIETPEFQERQVLDFKARLDKLLKLQANGYALSAYLQSALGRATVLDHHVNRPGDVAPDFRDALNRFYQNNPKVSKNPNDWKANHSTYERQILDDYGVTRTMSNNSDSTSSATRRYNTLKNALGA